MKRLYCLILCFCLIIGADAVFASDSEEAALAEAAEYLAGGITVTGDIYSYKAKNGISVGIQWDSVYDNTIWDEKGSYLNTAYLTADGKVTRPLWFEGTKKLNASATLTAGRESRTVDNISVALPPGSEPPTFDVSTLTDYIDIGNMASEQITYKGRTVKRLESVRDNGVQNNTVGGIKHTYRTLNKNGALAVTMKCDGTSVNYLTVKLWGSDTGDTMLWVCDPETGYMNAANNGQPTRNSLVDRRDRVELNFVNSSPQYEGGFIYSTYLIPKVYTEGRDYVSLRIYSTGGSADYSSVTIKEQTMPSRGIYAAYMTQNADFDPSDFETVTGGLAKTADTAAMSYDEQKTLLGRYARNAAETFKSWQIYGQSSYPAYMEGMVTRGTDWKRKAYDDADWKDRYYRASGGMLQQNMTPLNMYEIFSLAYTNADTFGYTVEEKAELLDRIVRGVDFLVRAQGANGGFFSSTGWIGGPNRKNAAGNNLTGFGLRSVAEAIVTVLDDVKAGGYLTRDIDADADGALDTKRKAAWESMMSSARDYLVSLDGAGHAPNQDMADIIAALKFEKALQMLNSSLSWKNGGNEEQIENELDIALGFRINKACSSYWVSPKGLILENFGSIQGGYSGDYGIAALEEVSQLAEFAEEYFGADSAKTKKYTDLMNRAYESSDKFMFTANAEPGGKPTLYAEGLISNRNSGYPGTERYVIDVYAAMQGNKTALKTIETFLKHNRAMTEGDSYSPANVHFEDNVLSAMKLYLYFDAVTEKLRSENIEEYDYLMEDKSVSEYAWADEMGRNAVIKNGDDKIYIALNWRNPLHSTTYYNNPAGNIINKQQSKMNNLARVHHKTAQYDKYGYAELKTVGWSTIEDSSFQLFENHYTDAFMYMKYGDYIILMNSNNIMGGEKNISYPIPWQELELDGVYKDLADGGSYYFGAAEDGAVDGRSVEVAPASTMVLYKAPPEPKTRVLSAKYEDSAVKVEISSDKTADICVYAAEYDGSRLVSVKSVRQTVKGSAEISFPYDKNTDSKVKIFVWNDELKPYCADTEK